MNGATDIYGILGWPVAHSRSPAMLNAAFEATGVNAVYLPFAVPPSHLKTALGGLVALRVCGVNVTLPHKTEVLSLLDEVDADARAIGAVNTIVRKEERLLGYNTDAPGLVRSLEEHDVSLKGATAVVLGAGGAARATVVGLARAGATHITVVARNEPSAKQLTDTLRSVLAPVELAAGDMSERTLRDSFAGASLLVQSTSATLAGVDGADEFAARLPLDALPSSAVVVDLVYKPRQTSVLHAADARGLRTVDGLGMLLHQGALAFTAWTGHDAPIEVMRRVLEEDAT